MYRTIVVGTDASPTADLAVERAAELAKAVGGTLHVVSAWKEPVGALLAASAGAGTVAPDWQSEPILVREAQVEAVVARLRLDGVEAVGHVDTGDAAATLVSAAARLGADLIVVGDRGLKGLRGMLGSVPSAVAHKAPVDVLVVHTS